MADLLIRGFPAEDLASLDEHANALGLSRTEFLRRHLHAEAQRSSLAVTPAALTAFADSFPDLADAGVMTDAWS